MIPAVVVPGGSAGDAYAKAASTILCDCGCPAQSVKECACGRAEEMRQAIAGDAASGKSGDAIIASYVARYGQKILIAPEASGFNLVAWVAPGLGLVFAAVILALVVRRWNRRPPPARAAGIGTPSPDDREYYARLAKKMEDLR